VSRPRSAALAAPLASGLLLWLASPAVGLGWVAWVALVPAAALALARPETRGGRLAIPLAYVVFLELLLVPALPFGLARDQWGEPPLPILVGDSPVLVVALVVVPLAGLALYALRFPQPLSVRPPWTPRRIAAATVVPAVAWTALDVLRAKFDPGGFWGPLFLSQEGTAARELAALAGPWVLTFALVAFNYALALMLVARSPRVALAPAGVAAAVLIAILALPSTGGDNRVRVAAVQPGYDTAEFDLPVNHFLRRRYRDLERASLDLIGDLAPPTREAARRGAELVVWPEATIWVDPRENARVGRVLAQLASETDATLVVPYFLRGPDHGAAVAVLPEGSITRAQPKQRPMWFLGEAAGNRRKPDPVDADGLVVGTLLGVDTQDPAWPRELAAREADILASSTHDWAALADQQLAFARLHATALATPLIRADWRYGSAIVGADGNLVAQAGLAKRRLVLVADVATGGGGTPFARIGDVFAWLSVAALAPLALLALRRRLDAERADAERPPDPIAEAELAADPPA
jgi:apolipoprotein N-acyltransferase